MKKYSIYTPETNVDGSTILVVLMLLFFIMYSFVSCSHSLSIGAGEMRHYTVQVTDKGIKRIDNSDVYLIYTKDTATNKPLVFQITDSFIAGRYNSADVYADIEIGTVYQFDVRGERSEFFSWYPNIYNYIKIDA